MGRDVAVVMEPTFVAIDLARLGQVTGGADASTVGRCGPDGGMSWLGNVYTPECKAHDLATRNGTPGGQPTLMSHLRALPLLPAAIGSYFRERFK